MGASSVTGLSGPGDSHGMYNCANSSCSSCGCGCGKEEPEVEKRKQRCYTKLVVGSRTKVKAGYSSTKIRVCS